MNRGENISVLIRKEKKEARKIVKKELVKSVTFRSFWQMALLQTRNLIQKTRNRHLEVRRTQAPIIF